jgi:glycosyltransferase involved in cell wall biosynthesis
VLADATWHSRSTPGESRRPWIARLAQAWNKTLLRRLDGPRTHYCFLSRQECEDLVAEAGVDRSRVHFTPFSTTIWGDDRLELLEKIAAEPGDYIFSGGNSSRDYRLLTQAVQGLGTPVRVATSRHLGPVPRNVDAGPVSPEEFLELMAGSRAVALPLSADTRRSVGQQTFLNALLLGKPVVVTDAPGVRDYLTDGVEALVVPPEPDAIRSALRWVTDPDKADQVRAMTRRGRQLARTLSPERYQGHLVAIARQAARLSGAR